MSEGGYTLDSSVFSDTQAHRIVNYFSDEETRGKVLPPRCEPRGGMGSRTPTIPAAYGPAMKRAINLMNGAKLKPMSRDLMIWLVSDGEHDCRARVAMTFG